MPPEAALDDDETNDESVERALVDAPLEEEGEAVLPQWNRELSPPLDSLPPSLPGVIRYYYTI